MSNPEKIPVIIHKEDSGAFVLFDDPLSNKNEDELQDDVAVLKARLKGKMNSSMGMEE